MEIAELCKNIFSKIGMFEKYRGVFRTLPNIEDGAFYETCESVDFNKVA